MNRPRALPRRQFLLLGLASGGALLVRTSNARSSTANLQTIERKDARDLSDDEVDLYREAFRRLQNRPEPSRTGYTFQARIHANHCPHGNWWFLPWHRAYLYYFEQMLQAAVRDLNPPRPPAVPYWNWTDQRQLPAPFRGTYPGNRLAHNSRNFQGLSEDWVGANAILRYVDRANTFTAFGSARARHDQKRQNLGKSGFEQVPHDHVHGQFRGGSMNFPPSAAFDPIFWSHHANIDRLWVHWLSLSNHANPNPDRPIDQPWFTLRLTEFVDTLGNTINRTVGQIMDDPAIGNVVYAPFSGRGPRLVVGVPAKAALGEEPDRMPYEVRAVVGEGRPVELYLRRPQTMTVPANDEMSRRLKTLFAAKPVGGSVLLRLEGLRLPKDPPAAEIRVFLNRPDADATTPAEGSNFVEAFPLFFFGADHEHGGQADGNNRLVDLTAALGALATESKKDNPLERPLKVTLVLVPSEPPEAKRAVPNNLAVPLRGATLLVED
jgi:tyrosinase